MSMPSSGPVNRLSRWHVYHIWCPNLVPKHYKYCLCVCPTREWFFYISSAPSPGRLQQKFDVPIASYQATFLGKDSYLDTSNVITFSDDRVAQTLVNPHDCLGPLLPSLMTVVIPCVRSNPALTANEKAVILTSP